jgi:diguanylate cyclase (GGDEF)-like protein
MPWWCLGLVALLFFLGAKFGSLTALPGGALLWLPNGVVLAALVRYGPGRLPALLAVVIATEVLADWPQFEPVAGAAFAMVNLFEVLVAYALLRCTRFDPRFSRPADLWKFVLAGPLVAALAAGFVGGLVNAVLGDDSVGYLQYVHTWWFGDGIGLLIMTPLCLGFRPFRDDGPLAVVDVREMVLFAAVAIGVPALWLAIAGGGPDAAVDPVLMMPFAVFAAARFPKRWVSVVLLICAALLVMDMKRGGMPFGVVPPRMAVLRAQEFLFMMALMALGFAALLGQLRRGHAENEQLATLALVDPLTGLYNRRGFLDLAQRELEMARQGGGKLALLLIDLDQFKAANDSFGHLAGDAALKHCASIIRQAVRATESCGRFGGDELIIIAPGADLVGGRLLADRICARIRESVVHHDGPLLAVTVSIGVTARGLQDRKLADLIARADQALYAAKSGGRDQVAVKAPDDPLPGALAGGDGVCDIS